MSSKICSDRVPAFSVPVVDILRVLTRITSFSKKVLRTVHSHSVDTDPDGFSFCPGQLDVRATEEKQCHSQKTTHQSNVIKFKQIAIFTSAFTIFLNITNTYQSFIILFYFLFAFQGFPCLLRTLPYGPVLKRHIFQSPLTCTM